MSATKERLMSDMKSYMKSGDKARLAVVRMLLTEIKNAEINDAKEPGRVRSEEEAIALVNAYHKQMSKTLAEFPPEKQQPIRDELSIVEEYLPKRLSREELKQQVSNELAQTSERNFGLLMKTMQAKFGSQTDGKTLSEVLKESLSS